MKNVFYHLFVFVCMASNASPINNDSIQKWESIPQEEFMAYALGLKTKLGHKTTQVFTIQEAKKRPVAFYDNAWLYDFTIKEEGTKNIKLLCLNREAQILITNDNAWNNIFKRYPPLLLTEAAVLDFFTLTNTNVVTSKEDLPIDLKNKIHLPRIMFQSENTYTIQSFLKEG